MRASAGKIVAFLAMFSGVLLGLGSRSVRADGAPLVVPAPAVRAVPRMGTPLAWRTDAHGPARLLWTGFRAGSDGRTADVVVQTSAPVQMEIGASQTGAFLRLKRCRGTRRRTDRLPLDTRFFDSSVSRVSMARRGHDIEIEVTLRTPGLPVSRQEPGPDGSSFWVFSFTATRRPQAGERS